MTATRKPHIPRKVGCLTAYPFSEDFLRTHPLEPEVAADTKDEDRLPATARLDNANRRFTRR